MKYAGILLVVAAALIIGCSSHGHGDGDHGDHADGDHDSGHMSHAGTREASPPEGANQNCPVMDGDVVTILDALISHDQAERLKQEVEV